MNKEAKALETMIQVIARMIPRERQARECYRKTSQIAPSDMTRLLFEHLAIQEEEHESKLNAALKILQTQLEEAKSKRT